MDLSWEELKAQLNDGAANAIYYNELSNSVEINLSTLTGTSIGDLQGNGVAKVLFFMIDAAQKAQEAKNAAIEDGDELNLVSALVYRNPDVNKKVNVRYTLSFDIPLDEDNVNGSYG